jgi:hypothetical protein
MRILSLSSFKILSSNDSVNSFLASCFFVVNEEDPQFTATISFCKGYDFRGRLVPSTYVKHIGERGDPEFFYPRHPMEVKPNTR